MESRKTSGRIDDIAAGEDVGLSANHLAATITNTMTVFHTWSHCSRKLPALRCKGFLDKFEFKSKIDDFIAILVCSIMR